MNFWYLRRLGSGQVAELQEFEVGGVLEATWPGTIARVDGAIWQEAATAYDDGAVVSRIATAVWTNDQIATQLVSGYWDGVSHHFNVSQGGQITVNLTALTSAGRALAVAALQTWSDLIGVTFRQVTSGGQIVFDDDEDDAFSESTYAGGFITSSTVNVSTSWLGDYGSTIGSYAFQTYIHEIGHALGLGHAGNYNITATYPGDALFLNDSWATSVMSYFSQIESTYTAGLGFTENFVVTPMIADIIAMQQLYGLSTTTRAGNTTYGYNSNAGNIFNASLNPSVAYTVFDSGGVDTLDFSGSPYSQRINLNAETYSSVNGWGSNLSIARGTIIENAIGGALNDTIIGNAANNVLAGGNGDDTVSYEAALTGVQVNLTLTTEQDTIGAGRDTLSGFEHLVGSAYDDVLTAAAGVIEVHGGAGNDQIFSAGSGEHGLHGDEGDDWIFAGPGDDWIGGGDGFDTVDYSLATGPVSITSDAANNWTVVSGYDSIVSVERIIGSVFNDTLWAFQVGREVWGGQGDDTLKGSAFGESFLYGGVGNDTYEMWAPENVITEQAGSGIDLVIARADYTLGDHVENLTIWSGSTSFVVLAIGNDLGNAITGNSVANILTGLGGKDTLTGGAGADTFRDTAAGLNGDTIADFAAGDKIIITDAGFADFSYSVVGNTLNYSGGSLTLAAPIRGTILVSASIGGGVELTIQAPIVRDVANDFDGDGRSDILFRHDIGAIFNLLGTPNGGMLNNGDNIYTVVDNVWVLAGTGDFNGDGMDDILWRRDSGEIFNFLGQADGGVVNNGQNSFMELSATWIVSGVGDFNGDGRDDVLWRNENNLIFNILGTESGGFIGNGQNFATEVAGEWHVAGIGDFNGDGRDDIMWRHDNGAIFDFLGTPNGGMLNNGDNIYTVVDNVWHIAGVGDFNGDGRDDILWRNDNGAVFNFLGTAAGGVVNNGDNSYAAMNSAWHVEAIGDYNGDGRDDILWRHDDGTIIDWLGTATGGFVDNSNNLFTQVALQWHVTPPLHGLGILD